MDDVKKDLEDTGERLLPTWEHVSVAEHLHRYALALPLAAGKRVLDIASGEGYGTSLLGTKAARVVGVDRSADAVAHATQHYAGSTVTFVQGDAARIPCRDAAFDMVVSFETIEHLLDQEGMLAEIRRVLAPEGFLVLSSPERANHGDKEGYVNTFHVRELYGADFLERIRHHFSHVVHLHQQVLSCSALWPATARQDRPEVYAGSFTEFSVLRELRRPAFHVVLAGNSLPAVPAPSLFDGTELAEAYARRQATEIANLNAYVEALRTELASRTAVAPAPAQPEPLGVLWCNLMRTTARRLWAAIRRLGVQDA